MHDCMAWSMQFVLSKCVFSNRTWMFFHRNIHFTNRWIVKRFQRVQNVKELNSLSMNIKRIIQIFFIRSTKLYYNMLKKNASLDTYFNFLSKLYINLSWKIQMLFFWLVKEVQKRNINFVNIFPRLRS